MAIVTIGNSYAEWVPSGAPDKPGCGRLILRSATCLIDLYHLRTLHPEDYRNLLLLPQTEKPVYWGSEHGLLHTAHPQSHDAEQRGKQEGR
jgi:hypothetical protein